MSWGQVWAFSGRLGASRDRLGGASWRVLGRLRSVLERLGASWGDPGTPLRRFSSELHPQDSENESQDSPQITEEGSGAARLALQRGLDF